jgi:uncharacterized protein
MPNRLNNEKSPYLLQHANNPVDWYPWGKDAFEKARAEQKPIFLSIGYSTCHWCHVMAHESFENERVAEVLNKHFVSIKVDREERPDVDRVYMTYVQAITGHGGWPLSAWLTPDLQPFFGGTYYPPEDRYGRPGFINLLRSIAQAWERDREKLVAEGERVIGLLRAHHASADTNDEQRAEQEITEAAGEAFEKCFQYFYESFDPGKGGFGGAPKFPRASNLSFIFRIAAIQGTDTEAGREAIKMGSFTLQKMAEGGIHDHVGGGFHRYSVDESWFVPHFEKMLYDQAQIALNYIEGYQATRREVFLWVVRDILNYVGRDLSSPAGAFYSAEDADSLIEHGRPEHAEGAYYVWTAAQIEEALRATVRVDRAVSLAELVAYHFDVRPEGNVPDALDPHHEFKGKNVLMQRHTLAETAQKFGLDLQAASDHLVEAIDAMRAAREKRPRPHRDDKVITAWNALMISAFARAAQAASTSDTSTLNEVEAFTRSAMRAARFLETELYDADTGELYRTFRDGRAPILGFAEDYAFLIQALLDLYELSFDTHWLQWAERLQGKMDELFWDPQGAGYFSSRAGDESILLRVKEDYDGAEPAPSSVGALNLLRLAPFAVEPEKRSRQAMQTLNALRAQWSRVPHALPQALCALEHALVPRQQVVLAGNVRSGDFQALLKEVRQAFGPRRAVFAADGAEGQAWLGSRAGWIAEMKPVDGRATAYVCDHFACRAPVTTPEALRAQLA